MLRRGGFRICILPMPELRRERGPLRLRRRNWPALQWRVTQIGCAFSHSPVKTNALSMRSHAMTPNEFRELLRSKSAEEIVETYILSDEPGPFITRDALRLLEKEARITFRLQDDHHFSTIVVGSAKLGFAYLEKPGRDGSPPKPAYRSYSPGESDIDVAVVSPIVYTRIWQDLARVGAQQVIFPWRTDLAAYMLHGWLRPDKFPPSAPQRCTDWKTMVQKVSRMEPFRYKRLRCGLFQSKYFLQHYQQRGVRAAQQAEMTQ